MSSYRSIHAIAQELDRIERNDPESIVYGVWNAILSFQFPVSEGYITRPQDEHTAQSGEKGYSDLHTFHYQENSSTADKFLIVQCKRAGYETHASVWAEGVDQLCQYLSSTHGRRRPSDRSPVYGIVAVGKYMRVYKYDDVNESVLNWSPNPRRLKKGNLWHLEENYEQVQLILDHIRDNH
ncbi:hypothetical protein N7522_002782 [Penicillium canescens]|uniref:Uncharacterized protein n=1 Tax=Penicillium canescens TaxID=5083 RepID=A0AAD6IKY9_PENCN|nr:uncharacterized protein N7446_007157 [Penicillium canescens]KAJ6012427.1 hypothetical protein N7522_002782 [Penicillium canescens]KAJ6049514.1 hypothetical protein N7444_006230 [Penicillium canescens]KAJ6052517.1 hypothetical protein N7460_003051 [Penicillium canescens]KAJ6063037.1 hypothetical protein N7446_007157 [Penicillium canescens]